MNYKKYNDYELIYNVRENDDSSYDILFNKYIPIIKKMAYNYYSSYKYYGHELEDFQQEAYISFYNATMNFDERKNSGFYSFVILCMNRALLTFCRKISCEKKNISSIYLVSIDDVSVALGDSNIEKYYADNDIKDFFDNIRLELEFEDSCIIELRYNGFTYKEISILLDLPLRKVQFRGRKFKRLLNSKK